MVDQLERRCAELVRHLAVHRVERDRVFGAQLKNLKLGADERVLSLLAVSFTPADRKSVV